MRIIDAQRLPTVTSDKILGFFGDYRFLSNFHESPLIIDGLRFPSAEHAYMAQKTTDIALQEFFSTAFSPAEARKIGRTIQLRPDWNTYRLVAMLRVLSAKFEDPALSRKLLLTGNKYLEETNNWGDSYWGVVDGKGANMLGNLLMLVRKNLRILQPALSLQEKLF